MRRRSIRTFYRNLGITKKIQLAITALIALTITGVTVIFSQILYQNILMERRNNASLNLLLVEEKLGILFDSIETDTKIALTHTDVQQVLRKVVILREEIRMQEIGRLRSPLNSIVYPRSTIDALVISDFAGNSYSSGNLLNISPPPEPVVRKLKEERNLIVWLPTRMSSYRVDGREVPVLSLYRMIYDYNSGGALAVLTATIREELLSEAYRNALGGGGDIFLLDREGTIVSHSDKSRLFGSLASEPFFQDLSRGRTEGSYRKGGEHIHMLSRYLPRQECYLVELLPDAALKGNSYLLLGICSVLGLLAIIVAVLISRALSRSILKPIHLLAATIDDAGQGDLEVRAPVTGEDEVGTLSRAFNRMLEQIAGLMDRLQEEHHQKLSYEFQVRQAQINPHFLYNTLDAVSSLALKGDNNRVMETIKDLSSFYRLVLSGGQSIIPLKKELDSLRYYLSILTVRYGEKLHWTVEDPGEFGDTGIVKLSLQPLVENAFYHGLKEKRGNGTIRVSLSPGADGKSLEVGIEDDGVGMDQTLLDGLLSGERQGESYGLRNVSQRIKLYYGEEYGLDGVSRPEEGTRIVVRIPLRRVE